MTVPYISQFWGLYLKTMCYIKIYRKIFNGLKTAFYLNSQSPSLFRIVFPGQYNAFWKEGYEKKKSPLFLTVSSRSCDKY